MKLSYIKYVVETVSGVVITHRKTADVVAARHIYTKLAREYTRKSYVKIGKTINRDHSTLVWAVANFKYNVLKNNTYSAWYDDCRAVIENKRNPTLATSRDKLLQVEEENRTLINRMAKLRDPLDDEAERLFSIFNSLPERLREDVMFKVETAHKINEKHKRDLTVIYTEG